MLKNNTKKIDVIVEARMSSSRLPGKTMMKVLGRPNIELMIERLRKANYIDDIIVATTLNSSDDVIVDLCNKKQISFYRGSENDVLGRVLQAAKCFATDIIVEITGDNPLADPVLVDKMVEKFLQVDEIDYLSNDFGAYIESYPVLIPFGLNIKIFTRNVLSGIEKITSHPTDREHVVNYILQNMKKFKTMEYKIEKEYQRPEFRFTMDYPEDFQVIKSVYENLYPQDKNFSTQDIFKYFDSNKDVASLNSKCIQSTYKY